VTGVSRALWSEAAADRAETFDGECQRLFGVGDGLVESVALGVETRQIRGIDGVTTLVLGIEHELNVVGLAHCARLRRGCLIVSRSTTPAGLTASPSMRCRQDPTSPRSR
jgi:hypothetical protein